MKSTIKNNYKNSNYKNSKNKKKNGHNKLLAFVLSVIMITASIAPIAADEAGEDLAAFMVNNAEAEDGEYEYEYEHNNEYDNEINSYSAIIINPPLDYNPDADLIFQPGSAAYDFWPIIPFNSTHPIVSRPG